MKDFLNQRFKERYFAEPDVILSCGGRFEVLGNHTDHNHGLCIAATCNLSIYGVFKRRDDNKVNVHSEGYDDIKVDLKTLKKRGFEKGYPSALIRGISAYLSNEFKYGGFDAYIKSDIPSGAGVSSSAAFELLIAQAINYLYNDKRIPLMTLCKASQYAEREYYGKMCGLLDQIGVAYGGLVYIDFKEIDDPYVKPLHLDLKNHSFLIVNSGCSHAELSHLYTAIPRDMKKVAKYFDKEFLRDVDYEMVLQKKEELVASVGNYVYGRAIHFYEENQRVISAINAIKNKDAKALIQLMNKSRISSTELLKNMYVEKIEGSPLEACELIYKASHEKAGVKINGGGFAGSVIALIPNEELDNVINVTKEKYGEKNVHLVGIRNDIPSPLQ